MKGALRSALETVLLGMGEARPRLCAMALTLASCTLKFRPPATKTFDRRPSACMGQHRLQGCWGGASLRSNLLFRTRQRLIASKFPIPCSLGRLTSRRATMARNALSNG